MMRLITQLRMIDWHYFEDETIMFGESNLITGDNGTGKSTIIDALQVLFIANLRKVKFNTSAHEENTRRTIITYLMGKTGTEGGAEYLRDKHDFSSFLAIEIKDVHTGKTYILGVVFDVETKTKTEEHTFFRIDEAQIRSELFYNSEQIVRNREEFFRYLKQNHYQHKVYRNNLDEYLDDVRQLAGRVKRSFFSLLQKGISFTPITNLRKFVYDYILDEEPVDVETMRSYVEKYKRLEEMIHETDREIEKLEIIDKRYQKVWNVDKNIKIGKFMVKRADWVNEELQYKQLQERLQHEELTLKQSHSDVDKLQEKRIEIQMKIDELMKQIINHDITKQENDIKGEMTNLESQLVNIKEKRKSLENDIFTEVRQRKELLEELQNNNAPLELVRRLRDGSSIWEYIHKTGEISHFPDDVRMHNENWFHAHTWLMNENFKWKNEKSQLEEEQQAKEKKIAALEKNQILNENHPSMKLKKLIQENVKDETGNPVPVHILCEVIDIKNPKWKHAIEGYLHTQKFDLLLPLGYFNQALAIYETYKFSHEIARVGLVHTDKLMENKQSQLKNSLAEEITTPYDYVQAYIYRLIGGLIKCTSEKDLKNYKRSITPTCMVYQNHTARQIPRERYSIPYIGRDAIPIQLKQTKQELEVLNEALSSVQGKIKGSARILPVTSDKSDRYHQLNSTAADVKKEPVLTKTFYELQDTLFHLDMSQVEALENERATWKVCRTKNDHALEEKQKQVGISDNEISRLTNKLLDIQLVINEKGKIYQEFRSSIRDDILKSCDAKWHEEIQSKKAKDIHGNYRKNTEGLKTERGHLFESLIETRTEYNNTFGFGGNPREGDNREYQNRLRLLVDSNLVDYKEKSSNARKKAYETFQEHFISKLKENIEKAKSNFNMLDHSMKNMTFGTDRYRFRIMGKVDMLDYYRMITDADLNLGHSLFSDSFYEKHGEVIEELFMHLTEEPESDAGEVEYYIDYRNYLDFELEIIDEDGHVSKFSKVALEKSGGETQVPFYVAILASFYHTYEMYHTTDTLRLVIFDEAFNRMDADRVEEAISFILKMGFQPVIVAPTGKIQLLAPHMQHTILVMKSNFVSYTESFSKYNMQEWLIEKDEIDVK